MVISLKQASPERGARDVGAAAKRLRLEMNLTRDTLSERSGVPTSTLRRFEETGLAPFLTVVRLAYALSCEDDVRRLFEARDTLPGSIDEMLDQENAPPRKRASRRR